MTTMEVSSVKPVYTGLHWLRPTLPRQLIYGVERGAGPPCELMTLAGWEKASKQIGLIDKISRVGE